MAVIGKIRERSGLLLVLVGGAMAAFILTDLFSNRIGGPPDRAVGEVGGEPIALLEFERRVNDEVESYRNDFGQQVSSEMVEQVRQSVWTEMVKERVLLGQVHNAGFAITPAELDDIRWGNNLLPEFANQPNFQNPQTGQPDRDALRNYFYQVQLNAPVFHSIQLRRLRDNRLYSKYNNLVTRSIFPNAAEARKELVSRELRTTFDFVALRYDSEPDTLFPVSESELKKYFDKHKNDPKHRQSSARSFEYVLFPVTATDTDKALARTELEQIAPEFRKALNDSTFAIANSESRSFVVIPYAEGSTDQATDAAILAADSGEVIGPYRDGDTWKLVKVRELAKVPEARVRHILLSTQQGKTDEEQKQRADSLLRVVKRDRSKFESLVEKFSDDPGSMSTGGVYEWFDKFRMVPEFTAASFDEPVGAITIAKTSYGYHIVEVLGQRDREERRIVVLERSMRPSPPTFREVYRRANDFSLRYANLARMREGAEELGLEMRNVDELRPDQRFVTGLADARDVITWVNRNEVGKVSEPLQAGENYVVAIVTGIREEGPPKLEDVREAFSREVIKEKKAAEFIRRMEGRTDLKALADELGVTVQTATDMALNSFNIPGGFSEFEVIGQISALEPGTVSRPLKGETAVYVVSIKSRTEIPAVEDFTGERNTLAQRMRSRAENTLYRALEEGMEVKDLRHKYY
jgi:peptidyl-prolyl cis-trans isomerase D